MFAQRFALYLSSGMRTKNKTFKDMESATDIPSSTLHNWAQGRTKNLPNDELLMRVAVALGDPPEIIQQMRHESLAMTTETNMLIAQARDKELMETFVELINVNTTRLLAESRAESDKRYVSRLNTVRDQYNKLYEEKKQDYAEQLAESKKQSAETYKAATDYLKKEISRYRRLLVIALVVIFLLGCYSVYAYTVFDRADPSRGINREEAAPQTDAADIGLEG